MASEITVFTNCSILTGDPEFPEASEMSIRDGIVERVGERLNRQSEAEGSRVIDLAGGFVIPGFNDCHMHVLSLGLGLGAVNIAPDKAPTMAALCEAVAASVSISPGTSWVRGRGYNQNLLAERRHPSRDVLDPVSGGHPVGLWHTSGHVAVFNTVALQIAGVADDTPDPPGGEIERDVAGRPTGVLKETAVDLVARFIPPPTKSEARDAILAASAVLASEGITSAGDAATGQHAELSVELAAYAAAFESQRLKTRINLMPRIQQVLADPTMSGARTCLPPHEFEAGVEAAWVRVGPVKIFSDGALTTRTAALSEPYDDSGGFGLLTWDESDLSQLIAASHRSGWQIATHAIGDRAIEAVLRAYEEAHENMPRENCRHRVEHATLATRDLIRRMRHLGVVAILQPEDIAVLGDAYPSALGSERSANNSPVRWFLEEGVQVGFSSDRPVTPGHPLVGVQAAVARTTATGKVLGAEQGVSAAEAIGLYTAGAAYSTHEETSKGRLKRGMLADFVVLDRDITTCPTEEIAAARVLMTVVGGVIAFQA